ncbi:hypothetical protein NECAME_01366 [Necator americanus]|uniref:SCP domain-containing protein n=1 Tax=Necator americanus TaxID=51031 RepID=W2TWL1_NECAM|nr:hypothetical protein NECAME_01366 [Necator americanus]ETN86238.1 hypothetical protein NECAME_01366 [Necator americanus]
MLPILLVILILYHAVPPMAAKLEACDENNLGAYRELYLKTHNDYRLSLAKGEVEAESGKLPGSESLFKFKYNCQLEGLAMAVAMTCERKPLLNMKQLGYGQNYYWTRKVNNDIVDAVDKVQDRFNFAVEEWWYTVEDAKIGPDVIYDDEAVEPFANIAYNKSISFGCYNNRCGSNPSSLATAYAPAAGTTENTTPVTSATDETTVDSTTAETTVDSTTTTVTSTTVETTVKSTTDETTVESNTQQTTVAPTTAASEMDETIRKEILRTHNDYRSLLSQGYVRNGKVGKLNLPTATNMLTMKYDESMETEAQAYADQYCLVGSGPNSGQNTHVIKSTSVTALDAFKQSMRTWWEQISSTSVGSNLKYTSTLEEKKNAPTSFTQMAWAETYKVGCGIKRCSSKTFVVCRYDPPGNILDKNIYVQGAICGICRSNCIAALCPTPEN